MEILDKEERYIDALVRVHEGANQWRITCIYGEPRVENRHVMWEKLQRLKNTNDRSSNWKAKQSVELNTPRHACMHSRGAWSAGRKLLQPPWPPAAARNQRRTGGAK